MLNIQLLHLLESVLGSGKPTSKNNVAFFSPFCNHQKRKLEIDLDSSLTHHPWHCWVSNRKGKNLVSLLKQIQAPLETRRQLDSILNTKKLSNYDSKDIVQKTRWDELTLPSEFTPLWQWAVRGGEIRDPFIKQPLAYLNRRGITTDDIIRYNIGYCERGKCGGRVIIPSYDINGKLNYYVARSYRGDYMKYLNPKVQREDIVPFESLISWRFPITLVEGVFDAIAVKFNAIPLLGKVMSSRLLQEIVVRRVPSVNVCLDTDARKDAMRIVTQLRSYGIDTRLVELNKKDPADIGFTEMNGIISDTKVLDFKSLLNAKMRA